jgi:hypothetical protein
LSKAALALVGESLKAFTIAAFRSGGRLARKAKGELGIRSDL